MVEPSLLKKKTALQVILLIFSQFLSISNSGEKLDNVTETMDSLFSSTLDTVAPLRLRKIMEKSPTPWYNEHTRALKRGAQKWSTAGGKQKKRYFIWLGGKVPYPTENHYKLPDPITFRLFRRNQTYPRVFIQYSGKINKK